MLLLGGRGFSEFGDYFGELAISWLIYTGTGSVFSLGVTWLFFLIPRSAMRLWGGVYVDRFDKKRVMLFTETARGLIFLTLALAAALRDATVPVVYGASMATGLIGAVFDIASQAVVPQLVDQEALLAANSFLTSTFQVDSVIGPAAAGVAIYLFGVAASLSIDGVSFIVLVLALLLLRMPIRGDVEPRSSWRAEFGRGWTYFKSRSELLWLGVLIAGVNFGLGGFWYVYALLLAKDVLNSGSAGYGLLNAFNALGIAAVSTLLGRRGLKKRRLSVCVSLLLMGVFVSLTSAARNLPEALFTVAAFGAAIPLVSIVQSTYYQRTVPAQLTGRVFGLQQFLDYVTIPAGIVAAIILDLAVGVSGGILISGLVILAFGVASLFAGSLGRLDRDPTGASLPPP